MPCLDGLDLRMTDPHVFLITILSTRCDEVVLVGLNLREVDQQGLELEVDQSLLVRVATDATGAVCLSVKLLKGYPSLLDLKCLKR